MKSDTSLKNRLPPVASTATPHASHSSVPASRSRTAPSHRRPTGLTSEARTTSTSAARSAWTTIAPDASTLETRSVASALDTPTTYPEAAGSRGRLGGRVSSGPSLYRRHRPRTFDDVVGQEHVVRTLRNAVEQGKVHHAYLFVGSRGNRQDVDAKILASCLNCENGPTITPCGVCESCTSIANATSLDVIEMDAASNNSVDDIRDLRERVAYAPVSGRHKVYILDEAHMLSTQAWNAFLKTLEEPPPNTIFVLATTEANKVLPTVVDRCHRFDFARPTVEQIAGVIARVAAAEQIEIGRSRRVLARHATGSFRDALGTLEQLVTYSGRQIATPDVLAVLGVADADLLFAALDAVAAGDAREALLSVHRVAEQGRDLSSYAHDLETHAREILVVQTLGEVPPQVAVTPDHDARLADQAARLPREAAVRLLDLLAVAMRAVRDGADARTQLELALVKAATPEVDAGTKALLARLERLEAAVAGGPRPAPPVAAPPAAAPAGARGRGRARAPAPGRRRGRRVAWRGAPRARARAAAGPRARRRGARGRHRRRRGRAGPRRDPRGVARGARADPQREHGARHGSGRGPPGRAGRPRARAVLRRGRRLQAPQGRAGLPRGGRRDPRARGDAGPRARRAPRARARGVRGRSRRAVGRGARRPLRGRVRRRGDRRRGSRSTRSRGAPPDAPAAQHPADAPAGPGDDGRQQEAQEALKDQEAEASSGGGMVKAVVTGDMRVKELTIDPDAVDPEDVEMLQDMLVAALNEALRAAQELQESAMAGAMGGGFDPMSALDALGGLGGAPGGGAPLNRAQRRKQR